MNSNLSSRIRAVSIAACLASTSWPVPRIAAAALPPKDLRAATVKNPDTPRPFPLISSQAEWQARAKDIRQQMLVSCGLWPLPPRTDLKASIFGRIDRGDYSIEKVYFQTYPGFYLAGNLYRPLGQGNGPFPAVLNPHGHWPQGRLADTNDGSIPARCIHFARHGMIAFSYDMVGFADTTQLGAHRKFFRQPELQLWNISLMGLQTYNSIRALDFLESLPEADRSRFACTGESGGGTQTLMLGGVDERIAAQAPVCMVSHSFQGDCWCENAPGLRVNYSNVEITAVPAPHPQILVAATGDWTKATLSVEGPALESIYRLFQAPHKLRYVCYDFGHNYNQTSREAVYGWFQRWLLHSADSEPVKERAYKKEADEDLRVWPGNKLPADALPELEFIDSLTKLHRSRWESLRPTNKASWSSGKEIVLPLWKHTLQLDLPQERDLLVETGKVENFEGVIATTVAFGRNRGNDRVPAVWLTPPGASAAPAVILADPAGRAAFLNPDGAPGDLAKALLAQRFSVLLPELFLTGELSDPELAKTRQIAGKFYMTYYNRTDAQERVQDLVTACAFARRHTKRVVLCGSGRAGLWALLAAPAADAVVADTDALDVSSDALLMAQDLFFPGVRNLGTFEGPLTLAAPNQLLLHNTAGKFSVGSLRATYRVLGSDESFREENRKLSNDDLAALISQWKLR